MRNKLLAILLCVPLILSCGFTAYAGSPEEIVTVAQVQSLCDGIVAYKQAQTGSNNTQELINGYLSDDAGVSSEFWIMALSQSGNYDFSAYERALLNYLNTHDVYSATSREKYALALCAAGSTDSYITDTADEAIGGLGIMSLVFGLHLLNNGYQSSMYSVDGLISAILDRRMSDGGWAVMGSVGDTDVTAMTLQALAPYYGGRSDVTSAVDDALERLSDLQLDSGGFKTMGAENCESAAQVVMALSALGIDAQYDDRFIKNGVSPMTALLSYRYGDGYAHTSDGGVDDNATTEAFCALTAYLRMCYGQSSFYIMDNANHSAPKPAEQSSSGSSGSSGGSSGKSGGGSSGNSSSSSKSSSSKSADRSDNYSGDGSSSQEVIIIDGRRYVESTNAAGEKVTVGVEETQAATMPTAAPTQKPSYGGMQPSASADQLRATADEAATGGYKGYAIAGVIAAAVAACIVLYLLKKRNRKNFIAIGIIAAAGIAFILLTNFESADSYNHEAAAEGDLTVTLTIRCDSIKDLEKVNEYVPDDGVVLDTTKFALNDGDTVYDALLAAIRANHIPMDNRGAQGSAYIAGLNFLYEYDYGELSGWMYRVNGVFPDVGCQSYYVSDGDEIEWLYTTNIGKDLE